MTENTENRVIRVLCWVLAVLLILGMIVAGFLPMGAKSAPQVTYCLHYKNIQSIPTLTGDQRVFRALPCSEVKHDEFI